MAIREDETAAAAMGINTVTTKLLAFSLGASFSGFAGAFTGAYQTAIFAESFSFHDVDPDRRDDHPGRHRLAARRGHRRLRRGLRQPDAPRFLGGAVRQPAGQRPRRGDRDVALLSDFTLVNYNYLIFGVILAVMMIKRPEGLFPDEAAKAEMHGIGIAGRGDGWRHGRSWRRRGACSSGPAEEPAA